MADYQQEFNLSLLAPELADAKDGDELLGKLEAFIHQRVGTLNHNFEQMCEIAQQDTLDEDDATRFHMALNRMETVQVDVKRLIEFTQRLSQQSDLPHEVIEAFSNNVESAANVLFSEMVLFSDSVLAEISDEKRATLFAFEPAMEKHYSSLFEREPDEAEEPAVSKPEQATQQDSDPLVYEGVQLRHPESLNPFQVYEDYTQAVNNNTVTDSDREKLAEAYTVRMLEQRAKMREATNSETADLPLYFERTQGIPTAITKAALKGELTSYPLLHNTDIHLDWEQVSHLPVVALQDIHPKMGETADRALREGWVQLDPKRSAGGGSAGYSKLENYEWTGAHPYVQIERSHSGDVFSLKDLCMLSHEMAHLVHFEEQARLGTAEPPMISNTAYMETISHIGEHMGLTGLRDRVPEDYKMAVSAFMSNRQTGMFDNILAGIRAEDALNKKLEGRSEPLSFEEISDAHLAYCEYEGNEAWDRHNAVLFRQGAHKMFGYIAAELGARAFENRYIAADDAGRDVLGERLLAVIQDTETMRWDEMMLKLGINTKSPDFLKEVTNYQKNLLQQTAEETGLPIPESLFGKTSFAERIASERTAKAAAKNQR